MIAKFSPDAINQTIHFFL